MKYKKLKICLLQIQGKETPELNSKLIKKYLISSLRHDPEIIFTPECSNIITGDKIHLKKVTTTQDNCPVLYECMQFAKTNNKFISIGSLLLQTKNSKKLVNRSFFINNKGKIITYYDKIHLFDVKINRNEIHKESKIFKKGNNIVIANSPWGKLGLTICYDIRFPNLYRQLNKIGLYISNSSCSFYSPYWQITLANITTIKSNRKYKLYYCSSTMWRSSWIKKNLWALNSC